MAWTCLAPSPQQDSGWWRCIAVAIGAPQLLPGSETVDLHLALWNLLPVPLHLQVRIRTQIYINMDIDRRRFKAWRSTH